MQLETAFDLEQITISETLNLLDALSELLSDPDYYRLALYLPFECMPAARWQPRSRLLQQAAKSFRDSYMAAWRHLLKHRNLPADFIDGDFLDEELLAGRDHPRVVVAAYLYPHLLTKGYLSEADVRALTSNTDDSILRESITAAQTGQGLPVLDFREEDHSRISPTRRWWLDGREEQQTAEERGATLVPTALTLTRLDHLLARLPPDTELLRQRAVCEGVRQAIELKARSNPPQGQGVFLHYRESLRELWYNPKLQPTIARLLHRCHYLGAVTAEQLATFGTLPLRLKGPFSKTIRELHPQRLMQLEQAVASLATNDVLRGLVFPTAIAFGSCLKGYGNNDIDLAVIVRPETATARQPEIAEALAEVFPKSLIGDSTQQYWTRRDSDTLSIVDEPKDPIHGSYRDTFVLLGGAWMGEQSVLQELTVKLLVPYLRESCEKKRFDYLEELERDAVLYRLCHRYEELRPLINAKQAFFDSDYRYLALQLYLSRVFLPHLS